MDKYNVARMASISKISDVELEFERRSNKRFALAGEKDNVTAIVNEVN